MKQYRLALVGLFALTLLILVIPAGRRVIWGGNEARYPLLAQDILDHRHWLVPELRGQLYLYKPQLYFWTIAVASLPTGRVSELSAAIPSVLSALAAVAAVVAIGTLLWGRRAGLLAGLILATAPPLFSFGHLTIPDMMLGAFLAWALYWLLCAWRAGWTRGPLVGFYLCTALAIASKGPAGFAALAGALISVLATDGRRGLARLQPGLGLLILALCALPWLVPYYLVSHGTLHSKVFVGQYGIWFFSGRLLARVRAIPWALLTFLPWSIFLVAAAWSWRRAPDEGRRRIVLWTLTLWALFVFAGPPQGHYLVPVYPPFALLTGEFLARGGATASGRLLRAAVVAALVYAIGLAVALILRPTILVASSQDAAFFPDASWERGLAAGVVVAGAMVTCLLARRDAWAATTVAVALTMTVILVLAGIRYPPRFADNFDVRPLAAAAASHLAPGGTVFAYSDLRLSYDFYLRRPVVEIEAVGRVLDLLASPTPGQVLITSREQWQDLISRAPSPWRVLATRTVGEREMVVVGSPPP